LLAVAVIAAARELMERPRRMASRPPPSMDTDWDAVTDDGSAHLTYHIVMPAKGIAADAYAKRVLEQRFNITLNYTTVDATAYAQKKPLLLASGNIPDVFNETGAGLATAAKHGFAISFPLAVIRRHAPTYVAMVNRLAPYAWQAGMIGEHNYGVPSLWLGARYPRVGIWREDWLRKLGIAETPRTITEFEHAFERITNGDPDGDGKANTWGLSGDIQSWYMSFTEIFGAHGVMPFNWIIRGDTVIWGGVQPEAKEALVVLRRWYENGYIHPDFVTDRWHKEVNEKLFAGRTGYVNYMASYEAFNPNDDTQVVRKLTKLHPDAVPAPALLPTGPRGERGHRVWGTGNAVSVFGMPVASEPIKVVRYLRMIETVMNDEALFVALTLGERGVHWQWAAPDAGAGSGVVELPPYDTPDSRAREGLQPAIFADTPRLIPGYLDDARQEKYLPAAKIAFRRTYTPPAWGRPDAFGRADVVPGVADTVNRLIQKQQTRYAEFILGDRSLDEFDAYVREWHAEGGDECLAAMAAYFTAYRKTLAEMQP
jgi:putative aldouronate transport system substrate-binding protein